MVAIDLISDTEEEPSQEEEQKVEGIEDVYMTFIKDNVH